jgi:iron complex outermembrane recepter protein
MLKSLLLLCSFVCTISAFAQKTTNLNVYTKFSNGDSANATIVITNVNDSTQVFKKTASNQKAVFEVPQYSKFNIEVSCVGYNTKSYIANITDKAFSVTFNLTRNTKNLDAVVVRSKKPVIRQEDDKTIVDVANLASASSNAYEVLEKTPGVIVDQDGNAYLSSATPATVFVNGREMRMSSADLAALLKNLPANSVSKIEILRTPSAKYDAASSGGIVNIVLKKGAKLGTNGSVNVGHFQGKYYSNFIGASLNKSSGKNNIYTSYQFTNSKNFLETKSNRFVGLDASAVVQAANSATPNQSHYFSFGIDRELTKKLNIAYDLRSNVSKFSTSTLNDINIIKTTTNANIGKNFSTAESDGNSVFVSNSINSKYKIDSLGSEWVNDLSFNFSKSKNNQDYLNGFLLPTINPTAGNGLSNNRRATLIFQTDFTKKLPKKFTFETGGKFTYSNSRNAADFEIDSALTGKKLDKFQTNTFKYEETIGSLYLQVAKTFGGFTLKPGLRMEYTNIEGNQIVPSVARFGINRTDFFPFVFLKSPSVKFLGFNLVGNLIYKRSIRRPYYEILNPFPRFVDQYVYNVGNPNVQPQFTTKYEANIMVEDFPIFAFGVDETKNIFSNVTYQDDVTKIVYRTYDNLGKNRETYFRAVGGIPPNGKYFFYMGAQHNFNNYDGVYNGKPLQYKRGSWVFFTYHEYKPTPTFSATLSGFWRSNGLQDFYELKNFGGIYLSANKTILKKKGNIILSINDPFRTNLQEFNIVQANLNSQGSRVTDTRRIGITFRYNFGLSKQKSDVDFGGNIENKVSQ